MMKKMQGIERTCLSQLMRFLSFVKKTKVIWEDQSKDLHATSDL